MRLPTPDEVENALRAWRKEVRNSAFWRKGELAPAWVQVAAVVAQHPDPEWRSQIFKNLRGRTFTEWVDERGAREVIATAECIADCRDHAALTAESAALFRVLSSSNLSAISPFDAAPTGSREVRVGAMFVFEKTGTGRLGQLVLRPYFLPDANLMLVRHPFNQTQNFAPETLASFDNAASVVRRQFQDSSALRDIAVMWSVAYASDLGDSFPGFHGASASAAFTVALALSLRDVPGMDSHWRSTLGRIDAKRLPNIALSAVVTASGELEPINGLSEKLEAWMAEGNATNVESRLAYVAKEQPHGRFAALHQPCASVVELLTRLADTHNPRSASQSAVIDALRHHETPTIEDLKRCTAEPASDLITHAAKRFAYWSLGANAHLATHFVPLSLLRPLRKEIDGDAAKPRDARPQEYKSLLELMGTHDSECHGYLLTGDPGGGKSTLLQATERTRAADLIRWLSSDEPQGPCPEVCIYLRLKDIEKLELSEESILGPQAIIKLLKPRTQAEVLPACVQSLFESRDDRYPSARRPKVRLLFDGLNELAADDLDQWEKRARRLAKLARDIGGERVLPTLFATRSQNMVSLEEEGSTVLTAHVDIWRVTDIEHYLSRRFCPGEFVDARAALIRTCETEANAGAFYGLPFNLDAQCELFENGVDLKTNRAEMLGLVYWLRLRREWNQRELRDPTFEAAVDASSKHLLAAHNRAWQERGLKLPKGALTQSLAAIAVAMWHRDAAAAVVEHQRGQVGLTLQQTVHALATAGLDSTLDSEGQPNALAAAYQLGLLVLSEDREVCSFRHQLWGEFFAARAVADEMEAGSFSEATAALLCAPPFARSDIEEIRWLNSQKSGRLLGRAILGPLEESAKFAIEMLAGDQQIHDALGTLTKVNLTLAARCAQRLASRLEFESAHQGWDKSAALEKKYGEPDATLKALRAELLIRFTQPVRAPDRADDADAYEDIRHRLDWGLLLGDLKGDARFELREGQIDGKAVAYLRPKEAYICQIGNFGDSTDYWIGVTKSEGKRDREGSRTKIAIKGFRVSAFPLTNAEFRFFVDAGGYHDGRWWKSRSARDWLKRFETTRGDMQLEPRGRGYKAEGNGLQPVVGITWFEANAYAAWVDALERSSHASASQDAEARVRLLTEGQWRAAAGGEGRDYGPDPKKHRRQWPYGSGNGQESPDMDPLRINFEKTKLGQISPVGLFGRGRTPEALEDMGGNTWEWTASEYTWKHEGDTLISPQDQAAEAPQKIALAGGLYRDGATHCRVDSRDDYSPGSDFVDYFGARLCGWSAQ